MKKYCILILVNIFVFSINLCSQEKIVSYTTRHKTLFSVPKGTNMKSITDLDLARMHTKEQLQSRETFISKKDLTMEVVVRNLDEPEYLSDYEYGIETTILNSQEIQLYNYYGKLVFSKKHESSDELEYYSLNEDQYLNYGFSNKLFDVDIDKFIEELYKEKCTVEYSEKENILKAFNDFMHLTIDYNKLIYELLMFENNELKYIDYKYYLKEGNYITPYKDILCYFEYLINGIRMLRVEEKTYLEYSVIEDDKVIYERFEKITPKSKNIELSQYSEKDMKKQYLKVFPNPASDNITIELPLYEGNTDLEIMNNLGNVVMTRKNINSPEITINISQLAEGSYIIYCKNNNNIQSVKFIKN